MAKQEIRIHLRATKVEVTPLHASGFICLDAVFDGKRRSDGSIENLDRGRKNLDFTCDHVRILGTLTTSAHTAGNLQNVFASKMLGDMELFLSDAVGVNNNLGIALAVAKIAENQPTMVAIVPSPASKHNLTPNITHTQLAACCGMHAKLVLEVRH